jgi:hypothetical protein
MLESIDLIEVNFLSGHVAGQEHITPTNEHQDCECAQNIHGKQFTICEHHATALLE